MSSPKNNVSTMEIHGIDEVIPTKIPTPKALSLALQAVRKSWPLCSGTLATISGVVVNTLCNLPEDGVIPDNVFSLFLYKTVEAQKAWDAQGWTEEHGASLICLEEIPEGLTFVYDNPSPELKAIAEAVKAALA